MRVTEITYGRLVNRGNFSNERLEVTVEVAEGEDPRAAVTRAKAFIERQLNPVDLSRLAVARKIVAEPEVNSPEFVAECQAMIDRAEEQGKEAF